MKNLTRDPDNLIQLWTRNGPSTIELMQGDITCLPVEDKVSLIMVSAYPGDYSAVSGTCIGALKKQLGISVESLSRDKELDLRKHFSCWLSKPIDVPDSPYKRLLCFERQRSAALTVTDEVRKMFTMFTPVFSNEENTVITPLLATGNQGHSKDMLCRCMIEAAAYWITAGLPLRAFKIVIYRNTAEEEQNLKSTFNMLKQKLLKENKKMKNLMMRWNFDMYVLFSVNDESYQKQFTEYIEKKKPDTKLTKGTQMSVNKEKLWQDKIFNIMITCKRIIVFLTPSFMESEECMEQYNMALCCNRLMGFNVLIPVYLQTIDALPTYMGLVQWIDTRVRKEGDTAEGKLKSTCDSIVESLEAPMPNIAEISEGAGDNPDNSPQSYDVFISYSHKNPDQAESLLKQFQEADPSLKLFYDRSSLTTGSNWQHLLYDCLGECRCAILLLSPYYLSSVVCNEEFNLAMARYVTQDKDTQLVPVLVEEVDAIPETMTSLKIHNFVEGFDSKTPKLVNAVCNWLKGNTEEAAEFVIPIETRVDPEPILSEARCKNALQQYQVVKQKKGVEFQRKPPLELTPRPDGVQYIPAAQVDIAVLYSRESAHFVNTFCNIVDSLYPDLNINLVTQKNAARMKALDEAQKLVAFISEEFLQSEDHMNELHLALCRQRGTTQNLLYLVQTNEFESRPFFPRILPYQVSLMDQVWQDLKHDHANGDKSVMKQFKSTHYNSRLPHLTKGAIDYGHFFALTKAAEDVLESLIEKRDPERWMLQNLLNILTVKTDKSLVLSDASTNKKEQRQMPISSHCDDTPVISKSTNPSANEASTKVKNPEKNGAEKLDDTPEDAGKSEGEVNVEHKKRAQLIKDQEMELAKLVIDGERGRSKSCNLL